MSTELYLPPTYATVDERSVFYVESIDNPQLAAKRKRESEKMKRYWSDKRHRRRIDKSQAKPVDVFTMEGDLVATYPSSRKAAIALFGEENYRSHERNIRACRRMDKNKKSHLGYQFRGLRVLERCTEDRLFRFHVPVGQIRSKLTHWPHPQNSWLSSMYGSSGSAFSFFSAIPFTQAFR